MLCFRCEHRSTALEGNGRARHECGQALTSKTACYMYEPCRPVVWMPDPDPNDPRPAGTGYFTRRSYAKRLSKGKLKMRKVKDGWVSYWVRLT